MIVANRKAGIAPGLRHFTESARIFAGVDLSPAAKCPWRLAWIGSEMCGVFSEFERAIIRERVRSGLERAKAQGKVLGRRRNDDPQRLASVQRLRKRGVGIGKIARTLGIGASYVQRVVAETEAT